MQISHLIRQAMPLALSTVLVLTVFQCSSEDNPAPATKSTIATIDGDPISETSFQRAFIPVLIYGDKFDSPEARSEVLNLIIGTRILAQQAKLAELDTSELVKHAHGRAERRALARKMYDEWVRKAVKRPTESELIEGFSRSKTSLFVRHLFAESEGRIRSYADQIANGQESFYTLAEKSFADSNLAASGGALGWITFGDLDENIEDTLYELPPEQLSEPVKSQYGWHLLMIDDVQSDMVVDEQEYLQTKGVIYQKIVERREEALANQVLNDFMSQHPIEFNREITRQVWPEVIAKLREGEFQLVDNPELEVSGSNLHTLKDETLLSVNGESWTVEMILDRLPDLERPQLFSNLYMAASNIVRDEMLAREAREAGFGEDREVSDEIRDAQDKLLADLYISHFADTMFFSSQDQIGFYKDRVTQRYHGPDSLEVEIFEYADSLEAAKAVYRARTSQQSIDLPVTRTWLSESDKGEGTYELARRITVGTLAGPVASDGEWHVVRLLERRRAPLPYDDVAPRVKKDMEDDRFNTTRYLLLKELRPIHSIEIFHDNLNKNYQ